MANNHILPPILANYFAVFLTIAYFWWFFIFVFTWIFMLRFSKYCNPASLFPLFFDFLIKFCQNLESDGNFWRKIKRKFFRKELLCGKKGLVMIKFLSYFKFMLNTKGFFFLCSMKMKYFSIILAWEISGNLWSISKRIFFHPWRMKEKMHQLLITTFQPVCLPEASF